MRQFMMTVMALAAFGATVTTAQAENNPSRTESTDHRSAPTCTGMKSVCISYPYRLYAIRRPIRAKLGSQPYVCSRILAELQVWA
jgi:hypothetical protein